MKPTSRICLIKLRSAPPGKRITPSKLPKQMPSRRCTSIQRTPLTSSFHPASRFNINNLPATTATAAHHERHWSSSEYRLTPLKCETRHARFVNSHHIQSTHPTTYLLPIYRHRLTLYHPKSACPRTACYFFLSLFLPSSVPSSLHGLRPLTPDHRSPYAVYVARPPP